MQKLKKIKFRWPQWMLYTLVAFFIFSVGTPSTAHQQAKRVQTEQRDEFNLRKVRTSVVYSTEGVQEIRISPFGIDLTSVLHFYSISIHLVFKNQQVQCAQFPRSLPHQITHIHPRAEEPLAFA